MADQTAPAGGMTVNTHGSATYADVVKQEIIKRLQQEAQTAGYFEKFSNEVDKYGKVPDAVVIKKQELKAGGDSVVVPMKMNIDPTFVYGDTVLLGNEASQTIYSKEQKINQFRAAVQGPSGNANHRIKYLNMIANMQDDIVRAVGKERDAEHFRALCEGYSLNLTTTTASGGLGITKTYHPTIYGVGETYTVNTATSLDVWVGATGSVSTNDVLDLSGIDSLKALAKKGITATVGAASHRIPIIPLNLEGKMWFVLLVHPNVTYTIQTGDSNAWRTGVEYAGVRGNDNPFFTGATWAYNGIILHEHPDVPSVLGGGDNTVTFGYKHSNTNDIKCSFLLGQGPLVLAEGNDMKMVPEEYDYKNQRMLGFSQINGIGRADFLSADGNSYKVHQGSLMIVSYGGDPTIA